LRFHAKTATRPILRLRGGRRSYHCGLSPLFCVTGTSGVSTLKPLPGRKSRAVRVSSSAFFVRVLMGRSPFASFSREARRCLDEGRKLRRDLGTSGPIGMPRQIRTLDAL
jgi:hypothetical protein